MQVNLQPYQETINKNCANEQYNNVSNTVMPHLQLYFVISPDNLPPLLYYHANTIPQSMELSYHHL